MKSIRIFFATDIHGSSICFKKFINAAKFYKSDVIIMGGDITGKFVIPIINMGRHYEFTYLGNNYIVTNKDELNRHINRIKESGFYTVILSQEEWIKVKEDEKKLKSIFREVIIDSLYEWLKYAEEKLKESNILCFIQPGNDDDYIVDEILDESDVIINPNEKIVEIGQGIEMISLGYSNITPWRCPRDIPEEELHKKITSLVDQVNNPDKLIFNIHVPPYGTGIDEAPELDENMRPRMGPGGIIMTQPVGSKSVREAILRHQPLLGLHGHIHEARGFSKLGKTLCLNPGSEYLEGILRGVLIQIKGNKIRDYIFTSG